MNESVMPVDDASSRLHLILNGNKVMFVFTELTGRTIRLHSQLWGNIKEVVKTELLPAELNGKKCFGLYIDGKMVCAITPASSEEGESRDNITIH